MVTADIPTGKVHWVHPPRNPHRLARLVERMTEHGWVGRPLLVFHVQDGRYQALTGSHRIGAARTVGLATIPAQIIPEDVLERAEQIAKTEGDRTARVAIVHCDGDEERVTVLRRYEMFEAVEVLEEEMRFNRSEISPEDPSWK